MVTLLLLPLSYSYSYSRPLWLLFTLVAFHKQLLPANQELAKPNQTRPELTKPS